MKLTDRVRGFLVNLGAASRMRISPMVAIRRNVQHIDWQVAKQPRVIFAAASAAVLFAGASGTMLQQVHQTQLWNRVYSNGTYVGMVPNDESIIGAITRVSEGYRVHIAFVPVHTTVPSGYDWQRIASLPTPAAAITLNGKPLVYTASVESARWVLSETRRLLTPTGLNHHASVGFVGHVSVAKDVVGVANILSRETALRRLLNPRVDSFSGRSEAFASTVQTALTQNTSGKITPTAATPRASLLRVQATEVLTQHVSIGYSVKYVDNAHLGVGDISVIRKGTPGQAVDTVQVRYVNGLLAGRTVLKRRILANPEGEVAARGTNSGIAGGSWGWPTDSYAITSPFGWRILFGSQNFHPGIDIGVPVGAPIYATNNGVVTDAGWNSGGYGIWVVVDNGNGIETIFAHMSHTSVSGGQTVYKGELLGYSGDTGDATGPHLHYEVRKWGTPVPPQPYM